jgi:hypothetical protein
MHKYSYKDKQFKFKYELVQYLHEVEGWSLKRISKLASIKPSTVGQLLHYVNRKKTGTVNSSFNMDKTAARLQKSINGLSYSHVEYYSVFVGNQEIRFTKTAFEKMRTENGVIIVE